MNSIVLSLWHRVMRFLIEEGQESRLWALWQAWKAFWTEQAKRSRVWSFFTQMPPLPRRLKAKPLTPPQRMKAFFEESLLFRYFATEHFAFFLLVAMPFCFMLLPTLFGAFFALATGLWLLLIGWVKGKIEPSWGLLSTGALMLAAVVAVIGPHISGESLRLFLITTSVLTFSLAVIIWVRAKTFLWILRTLTLLTLLLSLYGLYQRVVGVVIDPAWVDEEAAYQVMRIYSVFGNPNVFGEFLVLMLPVSLALFFREKKLAFKAFYSLVLATGGLALLLTYSRGAMLSVGVAFFLMALFSERRLLPLLLLGLLLAPFVLPASIWARLSSIFSGGDSSTAYRLSIYFSSFALWKDYWLTGIGLSRFGSFYPAYAWTSAKSFHAHNTLLMLGIEWGLLGVLCFLGHLLFLIRRGFSALRQDPVRGALVFALLAGILGVLVQSMVDHIFHNPKILFLYFTLAALVFSRFKEEVKA